jgi:hypothetical protein
LAVLRPTRQHVAVSPRAGAGDEHTYIRAGRPTSSRAGGTRTQIRVLECHSSGTGRAAPTAAGRVLGRCRSGGGLAQVGEDGMDRRVVGDEGDDAHLAPAQDAA